jgi:hypothetical protein
LESNDTLPAFATEKKFQVIAEELVAVAAYAMQREAVSEPPKGLRNYMFGRKRLR